MKWLQLVALGCVILSAGVRGYVILSAGVRGYVIPSAARNLFHVANPAGQRPRFFTPSSAWGGLRDSE